MDFCEYRVIAKNAPFHNAFSAKTLRFTPHIRRKCIIPLLHWIRCILPKAPAFSPTTISLTPRFRWKHEVLLRFFAEIAQNDPKTHSYEDSAKSNYEFSETTLSHALRVRRKRGVIENFEYMGEFEEYFWNCWQYCVLCLLVTERCKKKFKNRLRKSRACVPLSTCSILIIILDKIHNYVHLHPCLHTVRYRSDDQKMNQWTLRELQLRIQSKYTLEDTLFQNLTAGAGSK